MNRYGSDVIPKLYIRKGRITLNTRDGMLEARGFSIAWGRF